MGEPSEQNRRIRRALRTSLLAGFVAFGAALIHHSLNDSATSDAAAREFVDAMERDARWAGFRVAREGTESGVSVVRMEVPAGSCYLLAVAWAGRLRPDHDVRLGCAPNGTRITSQRPDWSSWTFEALDPARPKTHYVFLLGQIEDGFDPVAAVAAGIPLEPDAFTLDAVAMRSSLRALAERTVLARASIPGDAAVALPISASTLDALDATTDLRAGRGPAAVVSARRGPVPDSLDAPLAALHVTRRTNASAKRAPNDRRALAVIDPALLHPTGCTLVTLRFAGVGDVPPVFAHRVGTGVETELSHTPRSADDVVCAGDPVTIYSTSAGSTHDVILEASIGLASDRHPPVPTVVPASLDDVRAMLRGQGRPRDPAAALVALRVLEAPRAPGAASVGGGAATPALAPELDPATRMAIVYLRAEAHMRLARDPVHRDAMRVALASGCELGHAESCALRADVVRRSYGVELDLGLARTLFARACSLGHAPSCALATVSPAELGVALR